MPRTLHPLARKGVNVVTIPQYLIKAIYLDVNHFDRISDTFDGFFPEAVHYTISTHAQQTL